MKRGRKILFSVAILIVLVVGIYFFTDIFSKITGYNSLSLLTGKTTHADHSEFSECLDKKAATLYYRSQGCKECDEQMKLIQEYEQDITHIDCFIDDCPPLSHLPAWIIEGVEYDGSKTLQELKDISEC